MATTNVTGVTKHFPSAEGGFSTATASSVSPAATSVPLNSVAGYTNGEVAVFIIDPEDAGKKQVFTGTIDTAGTQVTGVVWTSGTNQSHAAGATVVDYATATHLSMVTKGLLVEHTQTGTHGAVTASSVATPGIVYTDTIGENTGNAGVTVDGLNIKDNKLNTNNSVVTANITNAAVTADKLATGVQAATVATAQSTTSTTPADLATSGPSVTVTIGANGLALVLVSANHTNITNEASNLYYVVSGANTIAATAISESRVASAQTYELTGFALLTGLTVGSTTFKVQYAVSGGGNATYSDRRIVVLPL